MTRNEGRRSGAHRAHRVILAVTNRAATANPFAWLAMALLGLLTFGLIVRLLLVPHGMDISAAVSTFVEGLFS